MESVYQYQGSTVWLVRRFIQVNQLIHALIYGYDCSYKTELHLTQFGLSFETVDNNYQLKVSSHVTILDDSSESVDVVSKYAHICLSV